MIKFKFTSNKDIFKGALEKQILTALEDIGGLAEDYAKMELQKPKPHADGTVRPNVDTGNLVNSIDHGIEGKNTAVIGTNVEYAAYLEFGTSRMRPYPYLNPAVMNHIDEYREIALEHLQNG